MSQTIDLAPAPPVGTSARADGHDRHASDVNHASHVSRGAHGLDPRWSAPAAGSTPAEPLCYCQVRRPRRPRRALHWYGQRVAEVLAVVLLVAAPGPLWQVIHGATPWGLLAELGLTLLATLLVAASPIFAVTFLCERRWRYEAVDAEIDALYPERVARDDHGHRHLRRA